MYYKDEIEHIIDELRDREIEFKNELVYLPKGYLCKRKYQSGRCKYYQRIPAIGNSKKIHEIGITNDKDMIMKLLYKAYLKEAISVIADDIEILLKVSNRYRPFDPDSLQQVNRTRFKELAPGMFDYSRVKYERWAAEFFPESDYHAESLRNETKEGYKVRSKSELAIMGRLRAYKIPFRYEEPLELQDGVELPDFTIIRPHDGKVIYWEHCGLITDWVYMRRHHRKMMVYEREGIAPWDNLIVTYDEIGGGIREKMIDAAISGMIL